MKSIIKFIGFVLLASGFSSCLKDEAALDPDNSVNVIEFKNPSNFVSPYGSKYSLYSRAFDLATENDYPITVSYSGAHVAPQDITVNLGTDPTALTQYNTEQQAHYDLIPSSLYTLPASVVIPKGQRTATVNLKVKSSSFDFTKNYVLPIQIQSTSSGTVSGNFGTILLNVSVKNKYDGRYRVTNITFRHTTNAAFSANTPRTRDLVTLSANSNYLFDPNLNGGSAFFSFLNNGSGSYFGAFSPVFAFDDAGNVTSVTNSVAVNDPTNANRRTARLDPSGVNKITISGNSKVMEVSYIMVQGGVDILFLKEKWEYTGARP
ncbi:hypothetical protein BWI93_12545 [Siphonobacter sp. BAB-5385]|uniref:DUF1735 domain-containing protein n=1 Tax=unclassified Siphonobacter TaxID=2635712 RepID=UPI000B9DD36E|nr:MULTISPECIES: DUF1735 domain-containing protein [unclassified Siphonobacter]OZI07791.1 hypothetical protein BWI93_12545 [Siphonobacter sp. BAB-5385]PMD94529.1 hypothetical protein BWI97_16305 [Siphonobacter sp. BAB-5405]